MRQDEVLYRIADRVKNYAVIYVCDCLLNPEKAVSKTTVKLMEKSSGPSTGLQTDVRTIRYGDLDVFLSK